VKTRQTCETALAGALNLIIDPLVSLVMVLLLARRGGKIN
jgi:hypothetical protein